MDIFAFLKQLMKFYLCNWTPFDGKQSGMWKLSFMIGGKGRGDIWLNLYNIEFWMIPCVGDGN